MMGPIVLEEGQVALRILSDIGAGIGAGTKKSEQEAKNLAEARHRTYIPHFVGSIRTIFDKPRWRAHYKASTWTGLGFSSAFASSRQDGAAPDQRSGGAQSPRPSAPRPGCLLAVPVDAFSWAAQSMRIMAHRPGKDSEMTNASFHVGQTASKDFSGTARSPRT